MPLVKHAHAEAAAATADEPTTAQLVAALANPQADARRNAARQLGRHPEAAGVLCTTLAAEEKECVREALFTALIRLGTKSAAEGLVTLLASEDAGLRNGAIEALATMPETAAACVFESMKNGTTDVRIFSVGILGALAHRESPRWLIRVIEDDPDLNVCAVAVDGLAECGDGECVAPLHRLLERFPNVPFLEFAVQTALTRIAGA